MKCILKGRDYIFVRNTAWRFFKNENILLNSKNLYNVSIHLKLSSLINLIQLIDIFSYDILNNNATLRKKRDIINFSRGNDKGTAAIIMYNFYLINSQERLCLFLPNNRNNLWKIFGKSTKISTLAELFFAANWLERELAELNGVNIKNKKDLRNLMLQYGDSSFAFQKSFPSIGLKEMYYNPIKDTIIQNKISLQV